MACLAKTHGTLSMWSLGRARVQMGQWEKNNSRIWKNSQDN